MSKLKICGIVRREDLDACAELGVDAVGINLWSGSKRGLSVDAARELLRGAQPGPLRVGVFVDHRPEDVLAAAKSLHLDAVQLHGDGPVEPFARLGLPYVWVIRGTPDLHTLRVPEPAPSWVLLDAWVAGFGGAGQATDWAWARQAVQHLAPLPVWLAGGIGPDNARAALQHVMPVGLDVASGAELREASPPGAKDREAIAALLRGCHDAGE